MEECRQGSFSRELVADLQPGGTLVGGLHERLHCPLLRVEYGVGVEADGFLGRGRLQ